MDPHGLKGDPEVPAPPPGAPTAGGAGSGARTSTGGGSGQGSEAGAGEAAGPRLSTPPSRPSSALRFPWRGDRAGPAALTETPEPPWPPPAHHPRGRHPAAGGPGPGRTAASHTACTSLGSCVLPRGQRAVDGWARSRGSRHGSSGHKGSEVPDRKGLHLGLSQLNREQARGTGRGARPWSGAQSARRGPKEASLGSSCPRPEMASSRCSFKARGCTRLAPAFRLSRVQDVHEAAFTAPSTQARTPHSWAPASGLGKPGGTPPSGHLTQHPTAGQGPGRSGSRSPPQPGQTAGWLPGPGPGPQRARGTSVRSSSGQPGSGAQMGWPQAQEQVTGQRSRVKATKSCMMYAAVTRRAWHLGQHTKPDLCEGPRVPPERHHPDTRSCTDGEGRGQRRSSRGSWWLTTPLRAASSGPSPPCPAAQAQRQSGGGKGRRHPRHGQGSRVGSCRSYHHTVHRGCGSPECGGDRARVPGEG